MTTKTNRHADALETFAAAAVTLAKELGRGMDDRLMMQLVSTGGMLDTALDNLDRESRQVTETFARYQANLAEGWHRTPPSPTLLQGLNERHADMVARAAAFHAIAAVLADEEQRRLGELVPNRDV